MTEVYFLEYYLEIHCYHVTETYLLEFCLDIYCHHITAMFDDCHATNQFLVIQEYDGKDIYLLKYKIFDILFFT